MKSRQKLRIMALLGTLPLLAMFVSSASSSADDQTINLGTGSSFGVIAKTGITDDGHTFIKGDAGDDIGLESGSHLFDSSTVTSEGSVHISDDAVVKALADLETEYTALCARTPVVLGSSDLASKTITPGTYISSNGTFSNSGTLKLDAQGDGNAVFVFQAPASLSTSAGSDMQLLNGAQASNVYWCVGGTATLGANSNFVGHLLTQGSITAGSGAAIQGQLASLAGGVSLSSNTVTNTAFVAPATLIIIKKVVNTYGGTAVASDFMIHVTHNGTEVAGSPVAGNATVGDTFSLAPGTYLISEGSHDGYYGTFGSTDPAVTSSLKDGLVTVASGQVVTVVRTNYQVAPPYVPTPGPTASPIPPTPSGSNSNGSGTGTPVSHTQSGGKLPKTGSPWYNYLAFAAGLIALGGLGLRSRKVLG